MSIRRYILVLLIAALFAAGITPCALANDNEKSREYEIKAAFLYQFLRFIDWPAEKEKRAEEKEEYIIGIIGDDPFGEMIDLVVGEKISGKTVVIKRLGKCAPMDSDEYEQQLKDIRSCHILFVSRSEKEHAKKINAYAAKHAVLTVADMDDFLKTGGMINFIIYEKRVKFEINETAANKAEITIRSKLLRLAKRVI